MGKFVILVITICLSTTIGHAELIKIPLGSQAQANQSVDRPHRGLSKKQVEIRFGAPQAIADAIGEPPISSWSYTAYVVFFENDWVIHSVLKHIPIADQH